MTHETAPSCAECKYGIAALRTRWPEDAPVYLCVECARKPFYARQTPSPLEALLRPLKGRVVVLTDAPEQRSRSGLIILPPTLFNHAGKRIDVEAHTGLVVAAGPGWYARRSLNGAWLTESPGVGKRKPMAAQLGKRIAFLARHDAATSWWRGLAIIYDYAVFYEDEVEATQAAE
jgi:hypothetical protein